MLNLKGLKKSRKGDAILSTAVTLIVSVVVIIAILATIVILARNSDMATQHTLCRASVILRGKATVEVFGGLNAVEKITPILCKTEDLKVVKGKREEVKKQISNHMALCWWQFAEGSVRDIFKVDRGEKGCFVCYRFSIDDNLDSGKVSTFDVMGEPALAEREKDKLSSQEMMNFLYSEKFNPGIIYGGGTKNYYGVLYDYDMEIELPDEIEKVKQGRLRPESISGYVMDYSRRMDSETKGKISTTGIKLREKNVNMLVLVADEFKSLENSDARAVIENTRLNKNSTTFNGLLIMLDYSEQKVRVHAGGDLSLLLKDYEMEDILQGEFENANKYLENSACGTNECKIQAINNAFLTSIQKMSDKLVAEGTSTPGAGPGSYYHYISNGGYSWPIMKDIEAKKTYAIVYVGTSDEMVKLFGILRSSWNVIVWGGNLLDTFFNTKSPADYLDTEVVRPQLLLVIDENSIGSVCTSA